MTACVIYLTFEWTKTGHPWAMADWLVSYEEVGFIRRGLTGTVLLFASDSFALPPFYVVYACQVMLYLAIAFLWIAVTRGKRFPPWYSLLVFSPATFQFPVVSTEGAGRKDLLFITVLAFWCLCLNRKEAVNGKSLVVFCVSIVFMMLSHEGMGFFAIFFVSAYAISRICRRQDMRAVPMCSMAAVSLALLVFLALYGGITQSHQAMICTTLLKRGLPESICDGLLSWRQDIAWNINNSIAMMQIGKYYIASLLLSIAPAMYGIYKRGDLPRIKIYGWTIVAMLFTAPLYVVAMDFGRWIYVTSMSILFISVPLLGDIGANAENGESWIASLAKAFVVAAYATIWSFPFCFGRGIEWGPLWGIR